MQFNEFNFSETVLEGIRNAGFTECMPVQEEVYRHAMEEGKDVTVQSQTGSGKTAAFLLTIFERFTREPDAGHRALIVAPTRELAVQIEQEAEVLGGHLNLRIGCFHGGVSYGPQEKKLRDGVDIVIGTPGRLLDFAGSKKLIMKDIDTVVIDEADRLFDMGFYPDIRRMLKMMKGPSERQTMLFSATISQRVGHLSWEFMNAPEPIVINPEQITVEEISQEVYHVATNEKINLLLGLLDKEKPENAIVFTNTKDMAVKLSKRLSINDYNAKYIMGDLPQKKRMAIIKQIKEGELQILVATDVAARGLHINDLDLVVNYDIPEDPESYVHRIGRTARAGKSGKAITLACEKYVYGLEAIEKFIDMKIPVEWADEELYQSEDKSAGVRVAGNRDRDRDRDRSGGRGGSRSGSRSGSRDDRRGGRGAQGKRPEGGSSQRGGSAAPQKARPDDTAKKGAGDSTEDRGRGGKGHSGAAASKDSPRQGKPAGKQEKRHGGSRSGGGDRDSRVAASAGSPSSKDSLESRLAYYREKYGEDFQLTDSTAGDGGKHKESGKRKEGGKERTQPASSRTSRGQRPRSERSASQDSRSRQGEGSQERHASKRTSQAGSEKSGADENDKKTRSKKRGFLGKILGK
jgi:ATP-dependent RNA helicase RhlB